MQALDLVINCSMNYPLFESFPHKLTVRTSFLRFNLFCCLLAILKNLTLFSFQGAASDLFQGQIEILELQALRSDLVVEVTGLEPVTPCLQSRCSSS